MRKIQQIMKRTTTEEAEKILARESLDLLTVRIVLYNGSVHCCTRIMSNDSIKVHGMIQRKTKNAS